MFFPLSNKLNLMTLNFENHTEYIYDIKGYKSGMVEAYHDISDKKQI